jgi:hypothetical protein
MSEEVEAFFEPTFNRSVKLRARDHRLSSDGGVLLLREADERLGLIDSLVSTLYDPRRPDRIRYYLDELLRERIFPRALGYNVDDEVDLLAHDPAMRIAIWNRPGERVLDERGASQPTQSRLTDLLSGDKRNLEAVRAALPDWVGRHVHASGRGRAVRRGTLDIDSFPITVCGSQQGATYNGYYREKVYHPLVASFAPEGDYDSGRLGDGFVHAILRGQRPHSERSGALHSHGHSARFRAGALARRAHRCGLHDWYRAGLSDRRQDPLHRALEVQQRAPEAGCPVSSSSRWSAARGGLREDRRAGRVPGRGLAACAAVDSRRRRQA